jgi:uncharacterized integral membrane protein (TIGR00698 family)
MVQSTPKSKEEGTMSNEVKQKSTFLVTEDWWAVYLGLGIVLVALIFYVAGGTLKPLAVSPPKWTTFSSVTEHFSNQVPWYLLQLLVWVVIFSVSTAIMGFKVKEYVPGFVIIFLASAVILVLGKWEVAHDNNLEPPILALVLGLIIGNLFKMPKWFESALRTEYYIKTGIVLLGATLPFTLIVYAGPIAFIQATIVSVVTFLTIYLVGTRLFGLEKAFASVLGAGGAVCGVSGSIAVGAATRAKKEHISIGICIVALWALVMIFFLTFFIKAVGMHEGIAGAWIGTSEFADAAGFAAAASVGGDTAIHAYTLMKVIGRDIWIGIWAFTLSIISVVYWEKKMADSADRAQVKVIWARFPKFVIGFFLASVIMSIASTIVGQDAFDSSLKPLVITPVKTLRTWTFIFTFFSIGLTTRFKEIFQFGWKPLAVFTAGVVLNVPLGYFLSTVVFRSYWISV